MYWLHYTPMEPLYDSLGRRAISRLFAVCGAGRLMDKKPAILAFWGQIKSCLAGEELTSHEEQVPRSRLKQIESRSNALTPDVSDADAQLIDSVSRQKTTVSENLLRWSNNPDKGIRQEIRQIHQLGGVAKGYSIDPLEGLD